MNLPIDSMTRKEIRQAIGYGAGLIYVGAATATGSTSTIRDNMIYGGENDYGGRDLITTSGTNIGLVRKVKSFNGTDELVLNAVLTGATAIADTFELWAESFTVAQLNNIIDRAQTHCTKTVFVELSDDDAITKRNSMYEYTIPSTFQAIHTVEFVDGIGIDKVVDACDAVWTESVDGDVTVAVDNSDFGDGFVKITVATDCAAGDTLATDKISSVDLSDCDCIVIELYSDVALAAGDLTLMLDNTASCASVVEDLDIPIIAANTLTKVQIDLANPQSDAAIISMGIKMVTDKGAFNLWVRGVRGQKKDSRHWCCLSPNAWELAKPTTPKLKLTPTGYGAIGNGEFIRLSGYRQITIMSTDTSTSEVDPDYIIEWALATVLLSMVSGRDRDMDDKWKRSQAHESRARMLLANSETVMAPDTRWIER